jgi:hypothetical protein
MNHIDITDKDAAKIGRLFMAQLPEDYSWLQDPTEYLTDLRNAIAGTIPVNWKALEEWVSLIRLAGLSDLGEMEFADVRKNMRVGSE